MSLALELSQSTLGEVMAWCRYRIDPEDPEEQDKLLSGETLEYLHNMAAMFSLKFEIVMDLLNLHEAKKDPDRTLWLYADEFSTQWEVISTTLSPEADCKIRNLGLSDYPWVLARRIRHSYWTPEMSDVHIPEKAGESEKQLFLF